MVSHLRGWRMRHRLLVPSAAGQSRRAGQFPILPLKWLSGKMKKLAAFKSMPASNATSRFSDRVENYVRYRPGYPPEVLQALQDRMRPRAQPRGCRHRLRHRHLDSHAAGEWQPGLWRRAQCRDARGGRATAGSIPEVHQRCGNRRGDHAAGSQRGLRHRGAGGALVRSRARRGANSFAS